MGFVVGQGENCVDQFERLFCIFSVNTCRVMRPAIAKAAKTMAGFAVLLISGEQLADFTFQIPLFDALGLRQGFDSRPS